MRKITVFLSFVAIIFTTLKKSQCDQHALPDDIKPISYELEITPDLTSFTFTGIVSIVFWVKYSTNFVKLHCKNLELDENLLPKNNHAESLSSTRTDELCIFTKSEPFKTGSTYTFQIGFRGKLKDDTKGLFRTSYQVGGEKKWMIATNFYGKYAREAFPCFDEPHFKTPFKISIARNKNQKVISNMPLKEIRSHSENQNLVWDIFTETPPIPTHLVAFVVLDCSISSKNNLLKIHTNCNTNKNTQYALEQSEKVLTQLENFLSVGYNFSKLDIVTVPKIQYQLTDNWGLFLMREDYVIGEDKKRSHMQNVITTASMCHLFARHWFGEQVTPLAWEDSWLTEAFAGYMEFFVTDLVEPSWEFKAVFNVEILQSALWSELTNPGALRSSKTSDSQINQKYGSINYYKGASIIRMLEHIISRRSLRSAVQKYITDSKKTQRGLVTSNNLFEALRYQSGIDSFPMPPHYSIIDVMKSWTENFGYPVIKVSRNRQNNMIEIEQRTFVSRQASVYPRNQKWITPISCTTKCEASFSNTAPSEWIIGDEKKTLSTPTECTDEWVICNLQRSGYYRVNYDSQNWDFLIEQLITNMEKIHVLNRAQLIDDSFTFAFEGHLSYDVPLKLTTYLERETEIVPLLSAMFHFEMLYKKYEDTESRVFFCMCIKRILEKQIEMIGFGIKSTDSYLTRMGKPALLLIACKIGLKICLREALLEYNAHVDDLSNVQPDLKQVVYCTVLRESLDVQEVYDNLWKTYFSTDIAYDRIIILKILGCSRNENILKKTLSKLFNQNDFDISKEHENYVYDSILSSSFGIITMLKFARDQAAKISQFNDEEIAILKTILSHLEFKVQARQHLILLKTIRDEFAKLDNSKYKDFLAIIERTKISGIKRAKENTKMSDLLIPIFHDVLNIPPPKVPEKQTSVSSGFIQVSSLFLCVICLLLGNFLRNFSI